MGGTFYETKSEIWEGLGSLDFMMFCDEKCKNEILDK